MNFDYSQKVIDLKSRLLNFMEKFVYPNEQRKYQKMLQNSFQHGGISIEEMLVPILTMKPK